MGTILLIIVLVLILVIIGVIYIAYCNISKKVKRVSKDLLGTEDILQGLKEVEDEAKSTPLSISGGNKLYLPKIQNDFPEYHQETMEEKIKQFIFVYFKCLEQKNYSYLSDIEVKDSLKEEIKSEIQDLKNSQKTVRYDNIRVHAISVSRYTKTKEFATVKYQISLEYLSDKGKTQVKYEVDVSYLFEDLDKDSFSLRCSHCGASLNETSTVCEYCGTIVVRNITKVWVVSNFKLIKQVG